MTSKELKKIERITIFLDDWYLITNYLNWNSDVGFWKAQNEVIKPIHEGKFGSHEGFMVQIRKLIEEIKTLIKESKK